MSSILITHDTIVQNNAHPEQRHTELKAMLAELMSQPNQTIQRIEDMGKGGSDVAARLLTHGQQVLSDLKHDSQPRRGTQRHVESQVAPNKEYLELQHALTELSRRLGILPAFEDLNSAVERESDGPVSGGAYADVWVGRWMGRKVALKALREVPSISSPVRFH